jgi:prolyl 4-hydroxylase
MAKKKGMKESVVNNLKSDQKRKSFTCWLPPQKWYKKISEWVGVPMEQFEHVQVVYYKESNYFHLHYDQCFFTDLFCRQDFEKHGGARMYTILIYLNDPEEYEGGETIFPNLDVKIKGNKGDAIWFHNLDKSKNYVHPKSLHAGATIQKGEKWIANVWIRDWVKN